MVPEVEPAHNARAGDVKNNIENKTESNTVTPGSESSPGGDTSPARQEAKPVEWEPPGELFDNAYQHPAPGGQNSVVSQPEPPQDIDDIREYVSSTDTGSMGWRVGEIFRELFCPWLSDEDLRENYLGRLLREANRMVGEVKYDGEVMDKPRARTELAVALVTLYQEREDLHGREDEQARKDQPTAALNVISDQITRKVKPNEQSGNDFDPDDPIHKLVRGAEKSHR
jgi:hypothetical protein